MRIVITGGCGFLGSHIAEIAAENRHKVIVIDSLLKFKIKNKNIEYVKKDIGNQNILNKIIKKNDVIYHLASISDIIEASVNGIKTVENNILNTVKLLEVIKSKKIKKLIFASSIYVHSNIGGFYRISKKSSELFTEEYAKKFGFKFTILRFGSVYGPRQNIKNNISNMVFNALNYKKLIYNGDEKSERSFIYVKDMAYAAYEIISKKYDNKVILITGKKKTKVKKVLQIIKNKLKLKCNSIFNKNLSHHYIKNPYSYKELKENKFYLKNYTNLSNGVAKTIEYQTKKVII